MEKATSTENNSFIKLSIQVRLNGLSFCLLDSRENILVWYKNVDFPREFNPVKSLAEIEAIYSNEKELSRKVDEVQVLFSNELYNLVPEEFFVEKESSNYLKYNTKILKTDVVAHDVVIPQELVNVYIPYTNITNYFFDRYGEFEYRHSITVLIRELMKIAPAEGIEAFLNNSKGYFDLVIFKNKKLLLCNTFSYDTKEDLAYYLLFTAEQLKLDPSKFQLTLLGDISQKSPLYDVIFTYIKNVAFLEPELSLSFKDDVSEKFKQEAFLLIKSLE